MKRSAQFLAMVVGAVVGCRATRVVDVDSPSMAVVRGQVSRGDTPAPDVRVRVVGRTDATCRTLERFTDSVVTVTDGAGAFRVQLAGPALQRLICVDIRLMPPEGGSRDTVLSSAVLMSLRTPPESVTVRIALP